MGLRRVGALLLLLAVAGCSERTEVVVAVDTDLVVPEELDRLRFEVTGPDGTERTATADLTATELPVTLGLSHDGGALAPLQVAVIGELGGAEIVRREARTAFLEGETLLLRMSLLASCRGVECPDGQTCGETGCATAAVDPADLPPWSGVPGRLDASRPPLDGGNDLDAGADAGPDAGADAGPDDAGSGDAGAPDAGPCADCDDGIECTVDTCEPVAGCMHTVDHSLCPLGSFCDVVGGACATGPTFTSLYVFIETECSPCHTGPPYSGGLNMATRELAYADLVGTDAACGTGNVRVIPRDSRNSLLWRKLAAVDLCGARMPNGRTPLPMDQIDAVRDWINAGAPDN